MEGQEVEGMWAGVDRVEAGEEGALLANLGHVGIVSHQAATAPLSGRPAVQVVK